MSFCNDNNFYAVETFFIERLLKLVKALFNIYIHVFRNSALQPPRQTQQKGACHYVHNLSKFVWVIVSVVYLQAVLAGIDQVEGFTASRQS